MCQVYYEARSRALNNGTDFHLAAFTSRGEIGVNTLKGSARFRRRYPNSRGFHHERHAEVALLISCRVVPRKISVVRFTKDGRPTMAMPCVHCQNFLRHAGVKRVRFTNWEGAWEEMKL